MSNGNDPFEQRVRSALEARTHALDAHTRAKLAAARARALAHTPWWRPWWPAHPWVPASAVAACAVLVVSVVLVRGPADSIGGLAQTDTEAALELLLAADDASALDAEASVQLEAMLLLEEGEPDEG